MPTLTPGYCDIGPNPEQGSEPVCRDAAIAPDAMHEDAVFVSWIGLAALVITMAGAVFVG